MGDGNRFTRGMKAKAAMSSKHRIVIASDEEECKAPTAATDVPIGIIETTASNAGDSVRVVQHGETWIELAATLSAYDAFQINSTGGKAKALASTGYCCGYVLEDGDSGDIVKCYVNILRIPKA